MRINLALASAVAATMAIGAASAGQLADACTAQLTKEGRDPSGYCECLEGKVMASASLQQEFQALGQIADPKARYAAASSEAKAAMDSCGHK